MCAEAEVYKRIPNATKCKTWNNVKISHMAQDQNVVVTFDAICGLLLILALGLIGAMVFMLVEHLVKAVKKQSRKI